MFLALMGAMAVAQVLSVFPSEKYLDPVLVVGYLMQSYVCFCAWCCSRKKMVLFSAA